MDELSFLDDMSDFCDKSDEGNDGEFMWDAEMSFVVCAFAKSGYYFTDAEYSADPN